MDWLGGKRTKDMLTEGRTKDRGIKAKKIKDGSFSDFRCEIEAILENVFAQPR